MSSLIPWLKKRNDIMADSHDMFKKMWDVSFPDFETFTGKFFGEEQWPAVDVSEDNEMVYVKTEVPGMAQEDLDISHEDGVLTIKGEKKDEFEEKNKHSYYRESRYGTFSRAVPLGNNLDWNKVNAVYKDGLLTLSIPKLEDKKPNKIKVNIDS